MDVGTLVQRVQKAPRKGRRRLVALAGAPASGKSTLAEALAAAVPGSAVVPMDGFHLDNAVLDARGLRARKGSPESFDVQGFCHLIRRLGAEDEVVYPTFDRSLDKAIAGAAVVGPQVETLIVEGNYLLLDAPGWRDLAPLWDVTVYLDVPKPVLRERLLQRWRDYGFDAEAALAKAEGNDLPNAMRVADNSVPAQIIVSL